jgi:molybdopterin-guanine dinucleotide biosynthesis protein B
MIPVVAFVGRSGCGKTTLLTGVVAELARRGYRVAVIKHTPHQDVVTDAPGSDTARCWEAGAVETVLVTPERVARVRRQATEPPLEQVLAAITDVDCILVEGYKQSALPKLEVVRAACDPQPIPGLAGRIAFVTDLPALSDTLPCLALDDSCAVADFLIRRFLGGAGA